MRWQAVADSQLQTKELWSSLACAPRVRGLVRESLPGIYCHLARMHKAAAIALVLVVAHLCTSIHILLVWRMPKTPRLRVDTWWPRRSLHYAEQLRSRAGD